MARRRADFGVGYQNAGAYLAGGGGAWAGDNGGKSLEFSGAGGSAPSARVGDGTPVQVGIGNAWTIMIWTKPQELGTTDAVMWALGQQLSTEDRIRIMTKSIAKTFRITCEETATIKKDYNLGGYEYDTWYQLVFTWDGTSLLCYKNGAAVDPTKTTDDAMTQADDARRQMFGTAAWGADVWKGSLHQAAIWTAPISADAVVAIYNEGSANVVDLETDTGDYASSATLIHWWKHGSQVEPSLVDDYVGSLDYDVYLGDTALNDDNISTDYPGA